MSNLGTSLQQQNFDFGTTFPKRPDDVSHEVSQLESDILTACPTGSSVSCTEKLPLKTVSGQGDRRARSIFIPLQEWEGTVTQLLGDAFIGSMVDLSERKKGFQERAEFPLSDLPPDASPLLKEGAIFRWSIGYSIVDGTRYRASRIVFRRMPAWGDVPLDVEKREAGVAD
jgi:hypothetical protein